MARDEPHDGEGRSPGRAVAVFGGSDSLPGSPEYHDAYEVGRLLAIAGIAVVNGGYGGGIEGPACGGREGGRPSNGLGQRRLPPPAPPHPLPPTDARSG